VARILCIDDEPGIQRMVRNALERDGHVVTEALGCTAGRLLVEAGGYDLALPISGRSCAPRVPRARRAALSIENAIFVKKRRARRFMQRDFFK
jgi:hypothetical protein